ncbi:asparagine synthase (glutamine-hydrolyzing) [Streptomyces sp. YGL11-2]|uniref:asparagine synthase (glutamine-hydrolyzing) n=1 Tax=Streptomyces sp. YGL11-2 TaxID=3414028 RepID=UPI003CEDF08A
MADHVVEGEAASMCGLAGWVCFGRDLSRERLTVERMAATLALRGPDSGGVWGDGDAVVAHRRLAVIDLVGGGQPMAAETMAGAVVLAYTGEVYNFADLGAELRSRGHRFTTRSDTEVVLRGHLEWGERLPERLVGMFAYAVWDARVRRLTLVRDRLGIKPLFYRPLAGGLVFGSEPKAILAHPEVEPIIGLDGLRELFTFSRTPGHAVWSGMREVRPGHVLTFDAEGERERVYWSLARREHVDGEKETMATVRGLLEEAVAGQLVADVPLGVLLSGGLDSSAVTALAARGLYRRGERVTSYAVNVDDDTFAPSSTRPEPDAPYARLVAEHVHAAHHEIAQDPVTLLNGKVRLAAVTAHDLPTGMGDIDKSLYLLFRRVREGATVALSGEGADELFGGYKWFHQPTGRVLEEFPWIAGGRGRWANTFPFYRPEFHAVLDGDVYLRDSCAGAVSEVSREKAEPTSEYWLRVASHLHLTRFLPMMLDRKDRLSMAAGVEARVPYCDHRLVEYVYNVPWHLKTPYGRPKGLLTDAVSDLLPKTVLERRKSHYPNAHGTRYRTELLRQTADLLPDPSHPVFDIFDRTALTTALRDPTATAAAAMERALDTAAWLERYQPTLRY